MPGYTQEQIHFNSELDARATLDMLGYSGDAVVEEGGYLRAFCPIHKDQVRRSLVLDAAERTFRCQYTPCPAHKGGLLIDLVAMYTGLSLQETLEYLREGAQKDDESLAIETADRLIEEGRYAEGLSYLEQARSLNPANTITRCKLASLYLEMGKSRMGKQEYMEAAADYAVKGELDTTLGIYNLLVILSPADLEVRKRMAYLFSRLGRPKDAAEHLKWVVDQYLAEGRIDEAATMCERMTALAPDEPVVRLMLADILVEYGSASQAAPEYEAAVERLVGQGQYSRAAEVVEKALTYLPEHEGLRGLRDMIDAQPSSRLRRVESEGGAPEEDGDFNDWIASLEDVIERPTTSPEESAEISSEDARVALCRHQLEALDDGKMESMERFIRDMYADVRDGFESGAMSKAELRVIKEFYKAFCVAFEQIKRERRG